MPSRNRHREMRRSPASDGAHHPQLDASGGDSVRALIAPSGTVPRPPGIRRITTPDEADALAAHLLDRGRTHPVVVVSIPHGLTDPWIDASAITEAVKDLAEVVVLPTDASSWRFSELMPEMTEVYGGAGRVYPIDLAWTRNPYASPLRFAYDAVDGARSADTLISDALRMAHDAGLVAPKSTPTVPAAGIVRRVLVPSRAIVELDDGGIATIWQELTAPDVPVEDLLATGMAVRGELDPQSRRLDVTGMLLAGPAAVAHYRPDDVVLAKVREVGPDVVHLALHPDVVIAVPRDRVTGNPRDSLDDLFSVGEVVAARVMRAGADGLALRLDDVDEDEEPLPAPALLEGGPPWLVPPVVEAPVVEAVAVAVPVAVVPGPVAAAPPVSAPAPAPAPAPPSLPTSRGAVRELSLTVDAARAKVERLERDLFDATARIAPADREIADLRRAVQEHRDEIQRLRGQVARQKTQLRTRLQSAGKAKRSAAGPAEAADSVPLEPERQFRLDVYDAWLTRYSLPEREEHPLAPYRLGPEFLATLEAVKDVKRGKVVQVVVEVLTGLADHLVGRDRHSLRTGRGGDDPQAQREDGALAWRVALQRGTASARRLHYWQLGNRIELSRVALHDDMRS